MYYTLFIGLIFLSSRGVFETFVPKKIAYAISFIVFFISILYFFYLIKSEFKLKKIIVWHSFIFISSISISVILSIFHGQDVIYSFYIVYPISILLLFTLFYSLQHQNIDLNKVKKSVSVVFVILYVCAIAQQIGFLNLPGYTYTFGFIIRPSSLTGSYLHYPLIMILMSVFIHSINKKLTMLPFLGYCSVFFSFSRSGMMLILSILFFNIILPKYNIKLKRNEFLLSLIITLFLIVGLYYLGVIDYIINRVFSSVSLDSPGNDGRILAWLHGIDIISKSNLFFGNNFGTITNFTANLISNKATVVESGILQNLINFGLIGTIIFYIYFYFMFVYSNSRLMKLFVISFFFQSFVYQSIEVLPFIIGSFLLISLDKKNHINWTFKN